MAMIQVNYLAARPCRVCGTVFCPIQGYGPYCSLECDLYGLNLGWTIEEREMFVKEVKEGKIQSPPGNEGISFDYTR